MKHNAMLYGQIGGCGITAEQFLSSIPANASEITVRIHSPGGSVGEALAIYNGLRSHGASITTIVDGYAASSASFVMLAGDVREVYRNSILFVHHPWTDASGNADELRDVAAGLDVHAEAIKSIYRERTGMSDEAIDELMDESRFFGGEEAVELGFATGLRIDEKAENRIAAMIGFDQIMAVAMNKGDEMSKQKTRKEIEAEARELAATIEAQAVEIEEVKAVAQTEIMAKQSEVDALVGKLADMSARIDELVANDAKRVDEIAAHKAEVDQVKSDLSASVKAYEAMQAKLALAPFVDADLKEASPTVEQMLAESDEQPKTEVPEEPKSELEIYEAMSAGADRIAFWNANKKKIYAQMEKREKGDA